MKVSESRFHVGGRLFWDGFKLLLLANGFRNLIADLR
jgi:hypothetical protein